MPSYLASPTGGTGVSPAMAQGGDKAAEAKASFKAGQERFASGERPELRFR